MRAFLLSAALTLLSQSNQASAQLGWGPAGHGTVAAIAMSRINANATASLIKLLPEVNGDIAQIASWADEIRSDPEYAWSAALHYIDTPDWSCNYDRTRDCNAGVKRPGACVDLAIQNYTKLLSDPSTPFNLRNESIRFLTHFAGDISQPLHVGFTTDLGGNTQSGTFLNETSVKLHAIWDDSMINYRIATDFGGSLLKWQTSLILRVSGGDFSREAKSWMSCVNSTFPKTPFQACSDAWAMESAALACSNAYVESDGKTHIQTGFNLQLDYYNRNIVIIEKQIARAGVRLANILNHIFTQNYESVDTY